LYQYFITIFQIKFKFIVITTILSLTIHKNKKFLLKYLKI